MPLTAPNSFSEKQQQNPVLKADSFSYSYEHEGQKVLQNISLSINSGEFVVITGPNGAGKTTLSMSFIGAIPHFYGGTMYGMTYVDGIPIVETGIAEIACHLGAILADYDSQLVTMTVGEEIAFSLENRGFPSAQISSRIDAALQMVGLDGMKSRQISTLSGGQRQRLVIAATLATEPRILVFDEPTSSLDPEGISDFYSLVGKLNRQDGITVVIIEHHLEEVLPLATRLILMANGQILQDDSPENTLRYMYENHYQAEVPALYVCRLALEKDGLLPPGPYANTYEDLKTLAQNIRGVLC